MNCILIDELNSSALSWLLIIRFKCSSILVTSPNNYPKSARHSNMLSCHLTDVIDLDDPSSSRSSLDPSTFCETVIGSSEEDELLCESSTSDRPNTEMPTLTPEMEEVLLNPTTTSNSVSSKRQTSLSNYFRPMPRYSLRKWQPNITYQEDLSLEENVSLQTSSTRNCVQSKQNQTSYKTIRFKYLFN